MWDKVDIDRMDKGCVDFMLYGACIGREKRKQNGNFAYLDCFKLVNYSQMIGTI